MQEHRQQSRREELIKFAEYISRNDCPYAICYGEIEPFITNDSNFDCDYIVDEYLTNKL